MIDDTAIADLKKKKIINGFFIININKVKKRTLFNKTKQYINF